MNHQPLIPQCSSPCIIDGCSGKDTQGSGKSHSDRIRKQLGPHCTCFGSTPSCNIGLIGNEGRRVAHTCVDRIHEEPSPSAIFGFRSIFQTSQTNLTMRCHHAEDEEAEDRRQHDRSLEVEEFPQSIRSEERKRKGHQPEQEKSQHARARDTNRSRDSIRYIHVVVSENSSEHIC